MCACVCFADVCTYDCVRLYMYLCAAACLILFTLFRHQPSPTLKTFPFTEPGQVRDRDGDGGVREREGEGGRMNTGWLNHESVEQQPGESKPQMNEYQRLGWV